MIRGTASAIAPTITYLFNKSLQHSVIPDKWKISNVSLIPKSGDLSQASNYCPISLLPLLSKVLERIIHSRLITFLTENKLLSSRQFGFRPGSSIQDALLLITNDWHCTLKGNKQVGVVFFDIRKAFDSVPHDCFLVALANVGVSGKLNRWFENYLSNRKQRVILDGSFPGLYLGPLVIYCFHEFHH